MTRIDKLIYNLRDANQLLGEFVSHRNRCKDYYGSSAMYLDYNKLCCIIGMMTDYIGYIYGDLQEEIQKGDQDD